LLKYKIKKSVYCIKCILEIIENKCIYIIISKKKKKKNKNKIKNKMKIKWNKIYIYMYVYIFYIKILWKRNIYEILRIIYIYI